MRWSDGEFRRWLQEPSPESWVFLAICVGLALLAVILTVAGC